METELVAPSCTPSAMAPASFILIITVGLGGNLNGHPRAELTQATRGWEWGTEFDSLDASPLEKL